MTIRIRSRVNGRLNDKNNCSKEFSETDVLNGWVTRFFFIPTNRSDSGEKEKTKRSFTQFQPICLEAKCVCSNDERRIYQNLSYQESARSYDDACGTYISLNFYSNYPRSVVLLSIAGHFSKKSSEFRYKCSYLRLSCSNFRVCLMTSKFAYSEAKFRSQVHTFDTRQKIMSCNRLLKTGCNNIVGATLFLVVNNIEQYC